MVRVLTSLSLLLVPIVEIVVIILVAQAIGGWATLGLLVAGSLLGLWLARREGGRALAALRTVVGSGRMPDRELADGALVIGGAVLLIFPGFVTDVAGLLLMLPVTRPVARRALGWVVGRRLSLLGGTAPFAGGPFGTPFGRAPHGPDPDGRAPGRVVPGEVIVERVDEERPAHRPGSPAPLGPADHGKR